MSFSFDGADPHDLADDLDNLAEAVGDRLAEALETWVLLVEGTSKRLAPVDTGTLRASISSAIRREGEAIIKGYIGSNVSYAPFQELGTSVMEANPFLRPSIEEHRSDLKRLAAEAVEAAKADAGLA